MKNYITLAALALLTACQTPSNEKTFTYEGNPLVRDKFTADPATLVHDGRCMYMWDTMSIMKVKMVHRVAKNLISQNGFVTQQMI